MNDNIEYYYERLQENILIVEENEENRSALDSVTVNFREVFDYIKMFLIANKERYYGYFLMDMELRIDYFFDHEAGVNMDTMPFTLRINPLLLGKCSIKEMIFIICHEIEHIVLEHPAEAKKINHSSDPWESVALNYAMDASVNDRLIMEMNKYKLSLMSCPEDGVTSDFLSDEYGVSLDRLKDYLYYYDKIATFETQVIENKEYEDEQTLFQSDSDEKGNALGNSEKGKKDDINNAGSEHDSGKNGSPEVNGTDGNSDQNGASGENVDSDSDGIEVGSGASDANKSGKGSEEPDWDGDSEGDDEYDEEKGHGCVGNGKSKGGSGDDNLSLEEWLERLNNSSQDPAAALGAEDENFWDEADELIGEETKKKKRRGKGKTRKESNKVVIVLGMSNYSRIITAKNRPPGLPLHKWTNMDLPDEIKEQLRQYIQQVVDGIPDEMRGLFPSHQQEALNKALEKPQIKWDQVLRKYIGTIPNGYRKTRTRLDRRQPERFDISGKISRHTIDIVVAIDTSGSMSKQLLEKIFTEIFTILKAKEFHLTIIECDAEIQTVYEARTMSDVRLEVHGRGGTSFIPVIKYVNENKKYRKSLLIYFTDGMGDEHIPVPHVYRMLWVLPYMSEGPVNRFLKSDEALLSVKEPYGDVINMNVDPWIL